MNEISIYNLKEENTKLLQNQRFNNIVEGQPKKTDKLKQFESGDGEKVGNYHAYNGKSFTLMTLNKQDLKGLETYNLFDLSYVSTLAYSEKTRELIINIEDYNRLKKYKNVDDAKKELFKSLSEILNKISLHYQDDNIEKSFNIFSDVTRNKKNGQLKLTITESFYNDVINYYKPDTTKALTAYNIDLLSVKYSGKGKDGFLLGKYITDCLYYDENHNGFKLETLINRCKIIPTKDKVTNYKYKEKIIKPLMEILNEFKKDNIFIIKFYDEFKNELTADEVSKLNIDKFLTVKAVFKKTI